MSIIKKIIFFTLVITSSYSYEMPNPVLEQLKIELAEVGLTFDYSNGRHIVKALSEHDDVQIRGERGMADTITDALSYKRFE